MKKKYYINLSYQVMIEAESDTDAINASFYVAAFNDEARHVSAKVVRVELPIQPPMPTEVKPLGHDAAQAPSAIPINEITS